MSLEDERVAMKRLVERGEARAGHLESHHGQASIVINGDDLDAMRAIKARLEGKAAPGDTTEREADWFAFFCRSYIQRSDARQKESGLQYTEAETHDLAKECARHETEFAAATEDGARRAALDDGGEWRVKLAEQCGKTLAAVELLRQIDIIAAEMGYPDTLGFREGHKRILEITTAALASKATPEQG